MSQRDSGYARKTLDAYQTPAWVTEALLPHLPACRVIWEPAAGSGKMVRALEAAGYRVHATDIEGGNDFLAGPIERFAGAIVTNPLYARAVDFIERALAAADVVAMLLRTDFDHAKSRQHLFQHSACAKKLVLTTRIKWFEDSKGQPSFNHAWFVWDRNHAGLPVLAYGPQCAHHSKSMKV